MVQTLNGRNNINSSFRIFRLKDRLCYCRTWHLRRFVLTASDIVFAKVNEDTLLDTIPLVEIQGIESIKGLENNSEPKSLSESTIENSVDFLNAFQISTKKNGYNAGRKYFLRADADGGPLALINAVCSAAALAAGHTEKGQWKWSKVQEQVRECYNSNLFQGTATFLIMAVRPATFQRAHHTETNRHTTSQSTSDRKQDG
jgi:hypothetical protein